MWFGATEYNASWVTHFAGFSGNVQLGGDPRAEPKLALGITFLSWSGNEMDGCII